MFGTFVCFTTNIFYRGKKGKKLIKRTAADYRKIINLPRYETTRIRMPIYKRAAQFAPFAALAGYSEEIQEAHRITEERKEVDEHTVGILNERLRILQTMDKPLVTVTYFVGDERKPGGGNI